MPSQDIYSSPLLMVILCLHQLPLVRLIALARGRHNNKRVGRNTFIIYRSWLSYISRECSPVVAADENISNAGSFELDVLDFSTLLTFLRKKQHPGSHNALEPNKCVISLRHNASHESHINFSIFSQKNLFC